MKDWKSTVAAILSGIIGTLTGVMTYQVPAALMTPAQAHTWLWATVVCNILAISCRVWVGILTNNADAAAVAGAINNVAQAGPAAAPVTPATMAQSPAKSAVVVLAALTALCLPLAGCRAANSPAGPGASTPYQKAAVLMMDFSADLLTAQKTEINLHAGGVVDDATHRQIQQVFAQIDTYGPQIDALISAQASSTSIIDRVNVALAALNGIAASTTKLDANTRSQITTAVQLIQSVLQNVVTQLKTVASTEVDFGPIGNRGTRGAGAGYRLADVQPDSFGGAGFGASAGGDYRRSGRELRSWSQAGGWGVGIAAASA